MQMKQERVEIATGGGSRTALPPLVAIPAVSSGARRWLVVKGNKVY